ncbi:MAG: hypothetical protein FWE28_09105 [Oscillospiraceae bacterium]|nr:hypothetical protein [Oscillospiraceae bacterium]
MSTGNLQGSPDYLSRFYQPKVTAYEFLKYFFAYVGESTSAVQRDFVDFLHEQKQLEENTDVMEEINFRSNGIAYYSDDLDDALYNLQNGGLLGKMNPSFGVIIIKYSNEESRAIKDSIPSEYQSVIKNIAEKYCSDR